MNRRSFLKVLTGGAVGIIVAPVLAKEARGIDCSKSTRWENYYQGWSEVDQKLLKNFEIACKNYSFYDTMIKK